MAWIEKGISNEENNIDTRGEPIRFAGGVVLGDQLQELKNAYYNGVVDDIQVRDWFNSHVTIPKGGGIAIKPGSGRPVEGQRPLFTINPTRVSNGAQPFCFYFQNWEDIIEPVKFYYHVKGENLTIAQAREQRRVMLPVPPERIEWSNANSLEEVTTAVGNTFLHSGPQPLETIKLEGFFPHISSSIPDYVPKDVLNYGLYQAKTLRNMFDRAMQSAQPIRFTVSLPGMENSGHVLCTRVVVVSEFSYSYSHANGLDVQYSMTLRRWHPQRIAGFAKKPDPPNPGGTKPNQKCKKGFHLEFKPKGQSPTGNGTDVNGKPLPSGWYCVKDKPTVKPPVRPGDNPTGTKYTIKRGDTLWGIADRFLGKGTRWKEIYRKNKDILDKAVKASGNRAPNPDLIFPGTVIRLPKK